MRNLTTALALILTVSSASAADMRARRIPVGTLSPSLDMLATDMANSRAIAVACRPTDGSNLNPVFWEPRLSAVPTSQKTLFANTVKARSAPIIASMSGPDRALRCDDALDGVENAYPSIAEAGAGASPICWSDVTGTNACVGTGTDDILAGLDPLLDGY